MRFKLFVFDSTAVEQPHHHAIQTVLYPLPLWHRLHHQAVKGFAVIVLGNMTQLMQDNIVDTFLGRLNEVRVEG